MAEIQEKTKDPGLQNVRFPGTELVLPEHIPLWPAPASDKMKIDVTVNEEGRVWVIHDKPFPSFLEWIEFDRETGEIAFVTAGGKLQGLGIKIHPPMDEYVAKADQACVMMIRDEKIRDIGLVPVTVQGYGLIAAKRK